MKSKYAVRTLCCRLIQRNIYWGQDTPFFVKNFFLQTFIQRKQILGVFQCFLKLLTQVSRDMSNCECENMSTKWAWKLQYWKLLKPQQPFIFNLCVCMQTFQFYCVPQSESRIQCKQNGIKYYAWLGFFPHLRMTLQFPDSFYQSMKLKSHHGMCHLPSTACTQWEF